jgi:hypothetical protein
MGINKVVSGSPNNAVDGRLVSSATPLTFLNTVLTSGVAGAPISVGLWVSVDGGANYALQASATIISGLRSGNAVFAYNLPAGSLHCLSFQIASGSFTGTISGLVS